MQKVANFIDFRTNYWARVANTRFFLPIVLFFQCSFVFFSIPFTFFFLPFTLFFALFPYPFSLIPFTFFFFLCDLCLHWAAGTCVDSMVNC